MALFEEVTLEWRGEKHVIPPNGVMRAIAVVEDIVTLPELSVEMQSRKFKLSRLAAAYGALLRYAGAKASDEDVYASLFPSTAGEDGVLRAASAVMTLISMMVPPAAWKKAAASAEEAGADSGKAQTAAS